MNSRITPSSLLSLSDQAEQLQLPILLNDLCLMWVIIGHSLKVTGEEFALRTTWNRLTWRLNVAAKLWGHIPQPGSVIRLIGSILMDMNEEWITGKRYLNMSEFECQRQESERAICPVKSGVE